MIPFYQLTINSTQHNSLDETRLCNYLKEIVNLSIVLLSCFRAADFDFTCSLISLDVITVNKKYNSTEGISSYFMDV